MRLRKYQKNIVDKVINSTENLLIQLDTGAGKTPIIASLAKHYKSTIIVCHRNNLIKQASENMALFNLKHRIIASREIKKISALNNFSLTNNHYLDINSNVIILSIDTFLSQLKKNKVSFNLDSAIMLVDEAHHVANENKWQQLIQKAKIRYVGLTATPVRGDGSPLIKKFDGIFEKIIQADGYTENATEKLITQGYLAQYKIFAAITSISSLDLLLGDDVVSAYKKYMKRKQTLVVTSRVMNAIKMCDQFIKNGINAEVVYGEMKTDEIDRILCLFRDKKLKVLVSVDILNEGFNVPDSKGLIIARDCGSFGMYRQFCGRVLRPGDEAIILDLTGNNVFRYGLPSDNVNWQEKQEKGFYLNEVVVCVKCKCAFKKYINTCPSCGEEKKHCRAEISAMGYQKMAIDKYAYIEERYRNYLKIEEQNKLEEQLKRDKAKKLIEEYTDPGFNFQNNLVGRKLETFFEKLVDFIKTKESPFNFNLYFICHQDKFTKIDFYTQVSSTIWNKDINKAVELLYEKTKNDIYEMREFREYKEYLH